MGRVLVFLFAVALTGCSWVRELPPDIKGPDKPHTLTAKQRRILERLNQPVPDKPLEFHVAFYPPVVLQGNATWMTCYVPSSWHALRILTTIPGLFSSEIDYHGYQPRLIERLPCGSYEGVCAVLKGNGETARTVAPLEVAGCSQ